MKVFVWNPLEKCTDNYNSAGGEEARVERRSRAHEPASASQSCGIKNQNSLTMFEKLLAVKKLFT